MNLSANTRQAIAIAVIAVIVAVVLSVMFLGEPGSSASGETAAHGGHEEAGHEEAARGPHGGRLLENDHFALELTLFEQGVPPEYHVYAYADGEPLDPDNVDLTITLDRLGGRQDRISFKPFEEYLRGQQTIVEPHSFDVTVEASYAGQDYRWQFDNHEGRTRIPEAMAELSDIATESAGPQTLERVVTLHGRVQVDPDRLSQLRARFPGVVQSIERNLGARVKQGETLAVIQSNESLQNYALKAPIDGVIIKRNLQIGQATGEAVLFVIADLSQVWVELDVFGRDTEQVEVGQNVHVANLEGYQHEGVIDWISPLAEHASQSVRARIVLDNPDGRLRPGQFVHGDVVVEQVKVPLAVRHSAIQRFRDFKVVFARFDDTYEVRMLELGRRDGQWVEVLGGLEPGTPYVTQNSYLIKADIQKSGAKHAH